MSNDPREAKLFKALEDRQYLWRTLAALERESGMNESEVIAALWRNSARVIEGSTTTGEKVWALRERYWRESSSIFNIISSTSTSSGGSF
jgi:hypothetical protein